MLKVGQNIEEKKKKSEMKKHFISKFPNQNIWFEFVSPIVDVVKPPFFLTSTSTCMCVG